MNSLKFLRFWFPVIVYSGMIFMASSIEGADTPELFSHFDKVLHVLEYAVYGFLVQRALINSNNNLSINFLLFFSILICLLYGLSDEYHQTFVLGRQADISDLIADTLGGLLGSLAYLKIKHKS